MAFIQMDFESQYLGCRNPISILLPDRAQMGCHIER